ncbi:MAG: ABC transporter substrate-binding protein [Clostridiales bacterium]|nr:ABC transporter substrate-binding protein [Clostridiales bacterium]
MQIGLPFECMQISDQTTLTPTGEGLVRETTGGEIVPWLCESFEPDEVNSEIRFKLRKDVKFLDGSPLTGEVVEWNITKAKEHGDLNPAILGAEARGEHEVALILDGYSNAILNMLASQAYDLASKENYDKNGVEQAREYPVTTGPFKLKERVPGYRIVYERNDNYWIEGYPFLDGVELVQITDVMTQNATMLSTGDDAGDVLNSTLAEQIATLRDSGAPLNTDARLASGPTNLFPSSRNEDSPYAKYEVRQAVSYAIDRQTLCDARGFGILNPATQILYEGYKGHIPNANYCSYDPAKAKELLAQAGYPDGFSTSLFAISTTDQDAVVIIQKMLEDVGINARIEIMESAAGVEMRNSKGFEGLFVSGLLNTASTTSTFRMALDPDYAYNVSTWRPAEEMRPAYVQSRATLTLQSELVEQVHRFMMDNMVVIPLFNSFRTFVIRDNVHDTEFAEWSTGTWWLPHQTWKS